MYLATNWDTFNNTDKNSLDKDISDADSKEIIQHHFKLKKKHEWKYISYVWTFDVMTNVRSCTITRQGHSVSCESCRTCLWEEKLSLCQAFLICSKINLLNWLKFVPREFVSLVKTERFLDCWSEHFSLMNPQGSLLGRKLRWHQWYFMQTRMAALNFRCHILPFLVLKKDGRYVLLVQAELLCKGIWKI